MCGRRSRSSPAAGSTRPGVVEVLAVTPTVTGGGRGTAAAPADPTPGPGYDAVLLAGFGGPEGPDDVMPFLRNVTRGRGIPEERLVEVSHHYQALGGASPINEQNRALQAALQAELTRRGVDLPVLWGNRNWAPYLPDVIAQAHGDGAGPAARPGHLRVLVLLVVPAVPRGLRDGPGRQPDLVGSVRIDKVRPYFDRPGFRQPFVDGTVAASAGRGGGRPRRRRPEIVFTTHSIPLTMADTSGSADLGDHGRAAPTSPSILRCAAAVIDRRRYRTRQHARLATGLPVPVRVRRRCPGSIPTSTTSSTISPPPAGAG